jgi:hypothetical protein
MVIQHTSSMEVKLADKMQTMLTQIATTLRISSSRVTMNVLSDDLVITILASGKKEATDIQFKLRTQLVDAARASTILQAIVLTMPVVWTQALPIQNPSPSFRSPPPPSLATLSTTSIQKDMYTTVNSGVVVGNNNEEIEHLQLSSPSPPPPPPTELPPDQTYENEDEDVNVNPLDETVVLETNMIGEDYKWALNPIAYYAGVTGIGLFVAASSVMLIVSWIHNSRGPMNIDKKFDDLQSRRATATYNYRYTGNVRERAIEAMMQQNQARMQHGFSFRFPNLGQSNGLNFLQPQMDIGTTQLARGGENTDHCRTRQMFV